MLSTPFPWHLFFQIVLAGMLGALLGIERVIRGKDAGLRTSSMIAVGSCLFTILSIEAGGSDPTRIAAGIVTGVGFLGAGVLLKTDHAVHGLTTAANIWVVSAIGMAVGMNMQLLAILTTLFAILILVCLRPISNVLHDYGKQRSKHVWHRDEVE
jgi:putative Mg2+ transporter-C (MgtC) family protein